MQSFFSNIPTISPDEYFQEVRECDYKGEHYSVRDNGAVYRHAREGKKVRKNDNVWTFGKKNPTNGYMHIGPHRVHIIVATAFHGANDSSKLVVDHIDTNRCNNRPENLRWLTRLENALNNPITRKKIEYLCGDIQRFLNDPSCLRDSTGNNQDVMWMRTVTPEEAQNAYERVMSRVEKPSSERPAKGGKMGEWLYQPNLGNKQNGERASMPSVETPEVPYINVKSVSGEEEKFVISDSLTSSALQGNWRTPTEFLCCPSELSNTPIEDYFANLQVGYIFAKSQFGESNVLDVAISDDKQHLWVLTEQKGDMKPWKITEVIIYDGHFLHLSRHAFFSEIGGHKYFVLEQGKEWDGEDCIEDYC